MRPRTPIPKPTADLKIWSFLYPDTEALKALALHILDVNGMPINHRLLAHRLSVTHDRQEVIAACHEHGMRVV